MPYPKQLELIEKVRTIRSSALNAAKVGAKRMTKAGMKRASNGKTRKRKVKDPTKAANAALAKLSPEQIEMIKEIMDTLNGATTLITTYCPMT